MRSSAQTADPGEFEVIVAVDGSTDGTLEMLAGLKTPFPLRVLRAASGRRGRGAKRRHRGRAGIRLPVPRRRRDRRPRDRRGAHRRPRRRRGDRRDRPHHPRASLASATGTATCSRRTGTATTTASPRRARTGPPATAATSPLRAARLIAVGGFATAADRRRHRARLPPPGARLPDDLPAERKRRPRRPQEPRDGCWPTPRARAPATSGSPSSDRR